jgi:hypothetical protein
MRKKIAIIGLIMVVWLGACRAQESVVFRDEAGYVALAYQMIKYGYETKQPVVLISAAMILADHPAAGQFKPSNANNDSIRSSSDIQNHLTDIPDLLNDALTMSGNDSLIKSIIDRVLQKLLTENMKDRGRKYSPFVQEYTVKKNASVTLTTTFNGNEIAEVFVIPYKSEMVDLYIYNDKGVLIVSDKGRSDKCYSTFNPKNTGVYKIEIRNRGGSDNDCLLMTN